jgi:hypothetical protein
MAAPKSVYTWQLWIGGCSWCLCLRGEITTARKVRQGLLLEMLGVGGTLQEKISNTLGDTLTQALA